MVELVRAITGWETSQYELLLAGERTVTMARLVNLREGLGRETDILPKRMSKPFVTESVNEKPVSPETLQAAVTTFYEMMGWDAKTGVPTTAKLAELGINWTAASLG